MIVYLDNDFCCHLSNNEEESYIKAEHNFFDDIAPEVIEGYRYIPKGYTWTNPDGVKFVGEMISPWIISTKLKEIQWKYDKALSKEYKNALDIYSNISADSIITMQNSMDSMMVDYEYRLLLLENNLV